MTVFAGRGGISCMQGRVAASVVRLLALVLLLVPSSSAQTFTLLYPFNSSGTLSDGGWPEAGVTRDAAGNLYGTTFFGGLGTGCDIYYAGCGTVFKIDTSGAETVVHVFSGAGDGWNPTARLLLDSGGNLYGTTGYGGAYGHGTVFKIDTAGNETIIHSFVAGKDGARPNAGLVEDTSGNLYGTTQYGGQGCFGQGCGTVFRVSSSGVETVLYRFSDVPDGASPLGGVALDSAGNICGTTWLGGTDSYGTVFALDAAGNEKVLHSFSGGSDGANPLAAPVLDAAGNLYGTTSSGGTYFGTVYMVGKAGNESVLYRFTGGLDGAYPYSHLLVDASGNLYGNSSQGGVSGAGTVFELTGSSLNVLYGFLGANDGANPVGGLIMDSAGNLYGTTVQAGTYGWGTAFEIQP
jgi:uncharacterized repeat protein (TIGR03803 family)